MKVEVEVQCCDLPVEKVKQAIKNGFDYEIESGVLRSDEGEKSRATIKCIELVHGGDK